MAKASRTRAAPKPAESPAAAAQAAPAPVALPPAPVRVLRIRAVHDGFRRAGRAHYGTVDHPEGTFDDDQVTALHAEPNLVVEWVEVAS